ncbi:hypothetical protein Cgig2_010957 [Carnegiea gigantea]|uniref:Uncharacterized protein n=1 Tax=Carnegiea gigantea TaxID=171969 RepID=A0A9Q1JS41_9CARY|nr:hypothetical protein Cgig2_010957 [Carnegiea gigantea]
MTMDRTLGNERAPLQDGRKCDYGPYYQHSSSLQSLNVIPSSTLTSILVKKVRVKQGTLRYQRNDENKYVDVSKDYENDLTATILEKVNTQRHGPKIHPTEEEFYPTLHRLLIGRRNWGLTFQFRGKVGISLHDLERIGGLATLGATYEEFLPLNKDVADHNKYPTTVVKLLHIHAELCEFHKVKHIYYDLWLDHFYREYLVYFAYGEHMVLRKRKLRQRKGPMFAFPIKSEPQT